MKIKPIKNSSDYNKACERIWNLMHDDRVVPGTPAGDELEVLSVLAEAYENENNPIRSISDPVSVIQFFMEQNNLKQSDLVPLLGSKSRVSEILNRKRMLTIEMIHSLHQNLSIPYELLLLRKNTPRASSSLLVPGSYPKYRAEGKIHMVKEKKSNYKKK